MRRTYFARRVPIGCRRAVRRTERVGVALVLCLAVAALGTTARASAAAPEILRVAPGGSGSGCANPCASLSQAVAQASGDLQAGGASSVTILVAPGAYTEHVTIPTGPITIQGAGTDATTLRGGFQGTVLTVASGAQATVTDLSITGGNAQNGGGVSNAGTLSLQRVTVGFNAASTQGGGVYNTGSVQIDDSTILANQAQNAGAGIMSDGASSAATLNRDAIINNSVLGATGSNGGGMAAYFGDLTVRDSTIAGNVGGVYGGGVSAVGAGLTLVGDTISANRAENGGGISGLYGARVDVGTTIVAGNPGPGCFMATAPTSRGYNLSDDRSCFFDAPDQIGVDPRLGGLSDNGGPTKTMAIGSDSPAYDAAMPTAKGLCSGTDQRGVSRLQRGAARCDIGAFQVDAPTLYVANAGADSITAYVPGATGDARPTLTLSGPQTALSNPNGIAVDVTGGVFVADTNANAITEYAPEVTGNVPPVATIAGPLTQLSNPRGLARDAAGHLFVSNANNTVTEYAANASGNVAPIARIHGTATQLSRPVGLAIGSDGRLRVGNTNGTITVYAAGANGNIAPVARLLSKLTSPQALAFDSAGRLLISDAATNRVATLAVSASGKATQVRTLTGVSPSLSAPIGIDVDDLDDLFVASAATNTVTEYAPGASGAASPLAAIVGPNTGLKVPTFLAELPPAPYPTVSITRPGRRSLARIHRAGLSITIRTGGRLAFRSAPLRLTAALRVTATTVATGRLIITRAGVAKLTLLPVQRVPGRIWRTKSRQAMLQLAFRHATEKRTHRLRIRLTP